MKKKLIKRIIWGFVLVFALMNGVAIFHSYKFTHFTGDSTQKKKRPGDMNTLEKLKALAFGVDNPRPLNKIKPTDYQEIVLQSNKKIACWYKERKPSINDTVKGTVLIFHGYSSEKSSMLDKARVFDSLNYSTFLVDFMGSGGSEGNVTTIGYKEAEQVKTAYLHLRHKGVKSIYLVGTSMGAVAILKAINDYGINPEGIIIECPFGSMYKTVSARFKNMNVPAFPMADLLVFWGGVQNGFWAFGHNPTEYAKKIKCPTLLLYGEQDKNVSPQEIETIYANLNGRKTIRTYKFAGHENYLFKYRSEWIRDIVEFLPLNTKRIQLFKMKPQIPFGKTEGS